MCAGRGGAETVQNGNFAGLPSGRVGKLFEIKELRLFVGRLQGRCCGVESKASRTRFPCLFAIPDVGLIWGILVLDTQFGGLRSYRELGVPSVIIQFGSFEARDRFMEIMKDGVNRVYRREPWVAANISEETRAALIKESGVKIVPDTKLSPLSKR